MSGLRNFRSLGFVAICSGLLLLSSCTRPEADRSKIQISVPNSILSNKYGALVSNSELGHVVINVTGEGIVAPILYVWDRCKDCSNAPAAPTQFELDIPMGKNRLVQVLAVYEDSATESMSFYYGDVTKTLSASVENIAVPVVSVGSGDIVSGNIAGRYFNSTVAGIPIGPSGTVQIGYKAAANKPTLIIENAAIINGWFSFFGLSGTGIQMEYKLVSTGELLFGGPVNLDSAVFEPSSRVLKVALPVHKQQEGGGGPFRSSEAEKLIYGYWATASSGVNLPSYKICRDLATGPTSLYTFDSQAPFSTDDIETDPFPTNAALTNIASPMSVVKYSGGLLIDGSNCDGSPMDENILFQNYFKVTSASFSNGGKERVGGFDVPFRLFATGSPFNVTEVAGKKVIAGRTLPGVSLVFDTIAIYKRLSTAGEGDFRIESPSCKSLPPGFALSGSAPILAATGEFSVNSDITGTEATNGVTAIACGMRNGVISEMGYFIEKWTFSNGGGYGPPTPATTWKLGTVPFLAPSGVCLKGWVDLTDAAFTNNVTNSTLRSFVLTGENGTVNFYTDESCTGGTSSMNLDITPPSVRAEFYYTMSGSTPKVRATISGFGSPTDFFQKMASNTAQPIANFVTLNGEGLHIGSGECREFDVYFVGTNNVVTNLNYQSNPTAWTMNLGFFNHFGTGVTPSGIDIVNNCSAAKTTISSINVFATERKTRIAINRTGAAAGDFKLVMSSPVEAPGVNAIASPLYINPTPVVHHFALSLPVNPTLAATCYEVEVKARDAANLDMEVPAGKRAKFRIKGSSPNVRFHPSLSDCQSNSNPSSGDYTGWIEPETEITTVYAKMTMGNQSYNMILEHSFSASNSELNLPASPIGFSILASLSITSPPFGNVATGTPQDSIVTVTNVSGGSFTGFEINMTGGPFSFVSGNCGATIASGSTCTMTYRFTPVTATTENLYLWVEFENGAGVTEYLNYQISGTGI